MQAVLDSTERAPQAGTRLGAYRLLERVKQGGMSTVYRGEHLSTRASVAIKVMDSATVELKMVYREREIMQALEHEHIVPCLAAGAYGRYHYLVMPYLQGGTLLDRLEGSILPLEEVGIMLEQLTSAVAYLHAFGLLHRDIKPSNILFDSQHTLYLTDFGLVSWLGEKPGYDGHLMGTPHFMAPEIVEGSVDERSEIYSVGILLYLMLTGYVPFHGTDDEIYLHHWKTPPMAPSLLNPALPRSVEHVILCALEKDPAQRYQTIKEVLCEYQRAVQAPFFSNHAHRHGTKHVSSSNAASIDHNEAGSCHEFQEIADTISTVRACDVRAREHGTTRSRRCLNNEQNSH
jgi:eukaryotic-like serine/threonine-protein kinase